MNNAAPPQSNSCLPPWVWLLWKVSAVSVAFTILFGATWAIFIFAELPPIIVDVLGWLLVISLVITFYSLLFSIFFSIYEAIVARETTKRMAKCLGLFFNAFWEELYSALIKAERCFKKSPVRSVFFIYTVYVAIGNYIYSLARGLRFDEFGFSFQLDEFWLLMPILANCILFLCFLPMLMNAIENFARQSSKWHNRGYAQIAVTPLAASLFVYIWILNCFYNLGLTFFSSSAEIFIWILIATLIPCSVCLSYFVSKGEHWVIEDREKRRKIIFYGCAQFSLACVFIHLYAIYLYAKTQPITP